MISVMLFKGFAKDANSTRQPVSGSGAVGTPFQCEIFEPCSVLAPVIKLRYPGTDLQSQGYNYAHIPIWGRYYWITDQIFQEGFWYVHLSVDVLASWKEGIGASIQYVLRSSSNYVPSITDLKYPTLAETRSRYSSVTTPFKWKISEGTFIVGIANSDPNFGAIHYSALTLTQFQQLLQFLLSTDSYMGTGILDDMSLDTAKIILNPIQYIVSCKWYPFSIRPAESGTIKIGWWTSAVADHPLPLYEGSYIRQETITFTTIPKHPQSSETQGGSEREYLNSEPYSRYQVWLPPIGFIDIPASMMMYANYFRATYQIDMITGISIIRLLSSDQDLRQCEMVLNGVQAGIDIPLAQIAQDWRANAMEAVQNFTVKDIGNVITNIAEAALGYFVLGTAPASGASGTPGNLAAYNFDPYIQITYTPIASTNRELFGQPLCANTQISTLSGFVQCMDAHIAISGATKQEIDEIENFMNGGFRYE